MKTKTLLLLVALWGLIAAPSCWAEGVLALSSRGVENPWNLAVRDSFEARLNTMGLKVPVTYRFLDSQDLADPTSAQLLAELMSTSFKKRRPSVILALDLPVLNWLESQGRTFWGETPLLVGSQYPISSLSYIGGVSGVGMEPDLRQVLTSGLRLFKNTQEIFVVNDSLGPGFDLRQRFEQLALAFSDKTFIFLDRLSAAQLDAEIEQAGPDSMVVLGYSAALEAQGKLPDSFLERPVLPLYAYQISWGALGGPVLSAKDQGHKLAGLVVQQIEQGRSEPVWVGPSEIWYDQARLDVLDVDLSLLPSQAQLIEAQETGYPGWILALVMFLCLLLGLATFYLAFYFWKKSRAERDLKLANQWLEDQVNKSTEELEQIYHRIHFELSERKGAEEALFASELRFRTFVEHSPVGILVSSPDHNIEYANPALGVYFGLESEELTDRKLEDYFPSDLVVFPKDAEAAKDEGKTREWPLTSPDGEDLCLLSKSAFFTGVNQQRKAITFVVDITGLKRIENQLRQANEEARSAVRAKAEFLATMSHEIRTPLNSVLGMSHLMCDTKLDADQQDYIESILMSGENLLKILNGILDYSKIEAGRMQLIESRVDLVDLSERVVEMLEVQAATKGLELFTRISPELPVSVLADETRLNQIMLNLAGNAIKFTDQGAISLSWSLPSPGVLRLSVTDTGIGITKEQQSGLFEAFSQVDSSLSRKYGGTGLGLAISAKLVQLMDGQIGLNSQAGVGSEFFVDIPLKPYHRLQGEWERPHQESFLGKRVLWIGDLAPKRDMLTERLEFWGFSVTQVTSRFYSPEVLKQPLDLILVDNRLEGLDAMALVAELKQSAPCPVRYLRNGHDAKRDAWALPNPVRLKPLFESLKHALGGTSAKSKKREKTHYPDLGRKYPMNILVADDNPLNLKLASKMLERLGYSVELAKDGQEAVQKACVGGVHLVLMDIQMPLLDGMQAAQKIWDQLGSARPKIIALTANTSTEDLLAYSTQGFDGHLTKPLMPEKLVESLELWGRFFFEEVQQGPA
ncbi:MAG: response regulator [bacterium]|nr:response regulator [bacterium]